jgi:internalin A
MVIHSKDLPEALKRIAAELAAQTGKLDLSGLQISELPPELACLTGLQELDCSRTQVSDLEPLREFASLEYLNFWSTNVSSLVPLRGLTSLVSLNCISTQVTNLKPLRYLTSLQIIDCSSTLVSDLEPLRDLTSLQKLNCGATKVNDLEPLRDLTSLRFIDCSATQVSDLEALQGLKNLQYIFCGGTKVSELKALRRLTSLISLDCSHTQLSESDLEPLQGIATLLRLACDATLVSKLEKLRCFPSLQILDCSSTQVSDLEPIVDLQTLHTLFIRNLNISEFPRKLLFSEKLHTLDLTGANIPGIPEEALSSDEKGFYNCLPSLRAHVLDLEVEAIPINSVKILVLGNGGVGKTQLCRHLAAEPFDPTVLTTHGIALRTIAPASEGDATKYLWDFGGQDIYHSAHTLFMRTAAVFVVLWTPEQEPMVASDNDDDDPLDRLHPLTYWLEYVRTLGRPDSPVVVVQSQCDHPGQAVAVPPVDGGLLESFGCLSVCNFSARTPRGAASLQEALADASTYLRDRDGISSMAGAATWFGSNWRPGARPINSCPRRSACTAPSAKRTSPASVSKPVASVPPKRCCGFCTTRAWCFTARISSITASFSINLGRSMRCMRYSNGTPPIR